ncbi:hypothetical protein JCM19231_4907 [Vibrio ishigakensis]|uniref:Chemotaxis protein n=1 Tax=Vibrio ishigakensis TaxID=1481914 RepID=A0A0B8NSX0_9VIBR|nr:DUF3379 domain-containing protein [Vibrio ishigakensis]GAM57655.1 hypothetical protein JCM19231_4907 [Vibrio ishigakensis]GAM69331.1 hypothetical protein JCM19236_6574 [Vibrio sp. JCM 19236]GAM73427.1 hypothetical protein JCM19241_2882 [Vibrio ishigakensis]
MDDLEFRRRIMSDPKARDEELIAAITANESNARFADDVLSLDARIEQAMRVDAPDNLADKILFQQSTTEKVVRPSFVKRHFALAASIAFAFGVMVGQLNWTPAVVPTAQASLADTAMDHVVAEKPFIRNLDEQADSAQVNMKLSPFAYRFKETFPYHVYYLNHCGFGTSNAFHMVFQGEKGKVTLFITDIPSENAANFVDREMSGTLMPLEGASMIVVGSMDEDVEKIAKHLSTIIEPKA